MIRFKVGDKVWIYVNPAIHETTVSNIMEYYGYTYYKVRLTYEDGTFSDTLVDPQSVSRTKEELINTITVLIESEIEEKVEEIKKLWSYLGVEYEYRQQITT